MQCVWCGGHWSTSVVPCLAFTKKAPKGQILSHEAHPVCIFIKDAFTTQSALKDICACVHKLKHTDQWLSFL
jgi:hypothetical protein